MPPDADADESGGPNESIFIYRWRCTFPSKIFNCDERWDYGVSDRSIMSLADLRISDRSAKSLADLSEFHRSAKLLADL